MLSKVSKGCQESWAERKLWCEQRVRGLPYSPSQKIGIRVERKRELTAEPGLGLQQPSRGYQESWAGSKFSSEQWPWGLFYCSAGK